MLLTIDVGNSNVVYGLFKGKKLVKSWRFPTFPLKIPSIVSKIERVIVASVVPSINNKLASEIKRKFNLPLLFITARNIPKIKIRLKNKAEIGTDRLVDALAAFELYGGPLIVIDFGTATTFDVITAKGEYLGGAIAPGILLARNALYEQTAKLPRIEIQAPRQVIGKNTRDAMLSGLVYGYAAMVEGMVEKIRLKTKDKRLKTKVIATGGLAPLICKYTTVIDRIDTDLTLKGLQLAGGYFERRIK